MNLLSEPKNVLPAGSAALCYRDALRTERLKLLGAGPGSWSFKDLLELLLPLIAGALTQALEHLASLPSFSAAALCVFSLIEPSVLSAGQPSPKWSIPLWRWA